MKKFDTGFHYFICSGINIRDWCEKYDISIFSNRCTDCGVMRVADTPFVGEGKRRGLISEMCKCGESIFTFTSPELNRLVGK